MQALKELIYILKQNSLHPLNGLGQPIEGKSKMGTLYQGIDKGRFQSDEEAARAIYPEERDSTRYRKLKSDLREKLLNAILQFTGQQSDYSDYQRAYYECHREWLMVKILTGQNANTAALYLANRLLKHAEKFEFTMLCMDILSYLRIQYGLRESNDKKFKEADRLFTYYRKVYDAECQAEQLYTALIVSFVNSRSAKDEVHQGAVSAYSEIKDALAQYPTYRLHLYGHMIGLLCYTSINDYTSALEYCEQVITFFDRKGYEARVPLQIFYYQELICNIQLRQFEKGQQSAHRCFELMQDGTFNWFKYQELYFMLSLHTEQYEQGTNVLLRSLNHPRFQFLPDNVKELWRIYESYVYYLSALGKMNLPQGYKFKLAKFINETPIFSKDKSGMNIAILAIRLLFLILEKKYGQLLDEVEAVEQYCYRYLNGKNTQRSYCFIKLLLQIPLGHFDVKVIQKKAERYLDKLSKIPIQVANQTHEIEIIPYENLWALALQSVVANQMRNASAA